MGPLHLFEFVFVLALLCFLASSLLRALRFKHSNKLFYASSSALLTLGIALVVILYSGWQAH